MNDESAQKFMAIWYRAFWLGFTIKELMHCLFILMPWKGWFFSNGIIDFGSLSLKAKNWAKLMFTKLMSVTKTRQKVILVSGKSCFQFQDLPVQTNVNMMEKVKKIALLLVYVSRIRCIWPSLVETMKNYNKAFLKITWISSSKMLRCKMF